MELEFSTYQCSKANSIEYGFQFTAGGDDVLFDIVLGEANPADQLKIPTEWAKYEWAARAIVAASKGNK